MDQLPYKRLAGFGKVKRDDAVVFNFPAGDTVVLAHQNVSYYSIVRDSAEMLKSKDTVLRTSVKNRSGILTWPEMRYGKDLILS